MVPIRTVHARLDECDALALLQDENLSLAVQTITEYDESGRKRSRAQVQREIKTKEEFDALLQEAGVGCLLVGESLVKQDTPDVGIKKLYGRPLE